MDLREAEPLSSQEAVAAVAARMGHGMAELATDIRLVIEEAIPALREGQNSMLEASIRANVERMLGVLEHGVDPAAVEPPSAAVEYARRLAQRGVPILALIRAYRLGHATFLHHMIENLVEHGSGRESAEGRATLKMVDDVHTVIDKVIESLVVTYAQAREEWLNPNAILRARVRSVLAEKTLDIDAAQDRIGAYRLRQNHVGVELWRCADMDEAGSLPLLRSVSDRLAKVAGSNEIPLLVALDQSSVCFWLPLAARSEIDREQVKAEIAKTPDVYAAIGEPEFSLAGFRRTHEQALSAERVARASSPPRERVTPYAEIAPIAAMATDLEATRAWIAETLGPLAIDGERQAGFRETLRVFFATGGSYAATAKQLGLHRNTAQYRIRAAEELRGRPLSQGRLDVEVALLACHWLGPAVLQPPTE